MPWLRKKSGKNRDWSPYGKPCRKYKKARNCTLPEHKPFSFLIIVKCVVYFTNYVNTTDLQSSVCYIFTEF